MKGKQHELVISFLRGERDFLYGLGLREWLAFCRLLDATGLLTRHVPALLAYAPTPVAKQLQQVITDHANKLRERAEALAAFDDAASSFSLRFLVVKGMAASKMLRDDELAFDSSDIDILVHPDDIAKADAVLRASGWRYPGESFRARALHARGKLDNESLDYLSAPFPVRSSSFLPHFGNYYFIGQDGSIDTIELHDKLHYVPKAACADLIWNSEPVEICGRPYRTLAPCAGALLSLLSLYADSETPRANTRFAGYLDLKTCVDAHEWLHFLDNTGELADLSDLVNKLNVANIVGAALSNVVEIYPADKELADRVAAPTPSVWGMPYVSRVFNPVARTTNAAAVVQQCVRKRQLGMRAGSRNWLPLAANGQTCNTGFEIMGLLDAQEPKIQWRIPKRHLIDAGKFILQVILIPSCLTVEAAVPIACCSLFQQNGTWVAYARPMDISEIVGHASKVPEGVQCKVAAHSDGRGGTIVEIAIPREFLMALAGNTNQLALIPSVHEHVFGRIHRRFAGIGLEKEIERSLNTR